MNLLNGQIEVRSFLTVTLGILVLFLGKALNKRSIGACLCAQIVLRMNNDKRRFLRLCRSDVADAQQQRNTVCTPRNADDNRGRPKTCGHEFMR